MRRQAPGNRLETIDEEHVPEQMSNGAFPFRIAIDQICRPSDNSGTRNGYVRLGSPGSYLIERKKGRSSRLFALQKVDAAFRFIERRNRKPVLAPSKESLKRICQRLRTGKRIGDHSHIRV
ncbi:hypothetical protein SDC9_207831 [bioreactor metagenome]|uniref:Uncharacterized protein n=1 Tax=bioreactor metagenome TaxID=1076179 RepID=A0A645J9K5_9ZZZZ